MYFAPCYIVIAVLLILKINDIYAVGQLYASQANVTYYIEFERKYTWFDSQLACSSMNMTLVEISTSSKSQDLDALIKIVQEEHNNDYDNYLWIGGIRMRLPEQQFVWFSTGEKFTYSNWYGINPDFSDNNYFCVELVMNENRRWNDQHCVTRGGFVCEYSKEKINQQELHKNLLQVQQNLQQEVETLKEQINQELQKQNKWQQQFEEQKLRYHKELEQLKNYNLQQLEKLKNQYLETQEEQLKTITQMKVRNNETLKNELETQKQLQQQMQENLDEKEQLNKQLQVVKEQKSKLEEDLEMEKTKQLNQQALQDQRKEQIKQFKEPAAEMGERLKETIQLEQEMQDQIKKHIENDLQRNANNNNILVYSPYSMVFNYYTEKTDSCSQPNLAPIEFCQLQVLSTNSIAITE
ncbi:lectin subunit alpha-like [Calliphora vicina]|uniref:lectin subunit alpha-like n=1 Tax=Calliphora vicina TaxID=7373 RepID=UPI00325B40B8